jgi:septum formation protein
MDAFVLTDNWKDKAGGYEIQGLNAFWVKKIQGSYTNVMGLPIAEVIEDLKTLHPTWNAFPWKE